MSPISSADPKEWSAALRLLQGKVDAATRKTRVLNGLRLLKRGEIDPAGLLVAREGSEVVGVQLAVSLAGRSGILWPPQVRRPPDLDLENRLARSGLEFMRGRGVKVAHAVLLDLSQAAPLVRAGLAPMTHLFYLRHELEHLPPGNEFDGQLLPFDGSAQARFQETLLRTYERTLDCPELNGTRSAAEIIAGHQAQGIFRADRWRLAMVNDEPIGVLLLNALKDDPAWDLSYVGIVPERRGQAWGRSLIAWALHAARSAGAAELQAAVDERNEPALRLYRALGFFETARRVVLWSVLRDS